MARYHNLNVLSWIDWAKTDLISNKGNMRVLLDVAVSDGMLAELDNTLSMSIQEWLQAITPTDTIQWNDGVFTIKMWEYQGTNGLSVIKAE